jgi:hypothetical protein
LQEVREKIVELEVSNKQLREEMESLGDGKTGKRLRLQDQIKHNNAMLEHINKRLDQVGRLSTLSKTRHEAAHQLLFNSGVQKRGKGYPFWLAEGLAIMFESVDSTGRAGPSLVNTYRLSTYRRFEREGKLVPLANLLREAPRDSDPVEVVAGRYAQSWAVMHYLWNKQPRQVALYLKNMEEKENPDWGRLFTACFGEDLNALEAAVKEHIEAMPQPQPVARP